MPEGFSSRSAGFPQLTLNDTYFQTEIPSVVSARITAGRPNTMSACFVHFGKFSRIGSFIRSKVDLLGNKIDAAIRLAATDETDLVTELFFPEALCLVSTPDVANEIGSDKSGL